MSINPSFVENNLTTVRESIIDNTDNNNELAFQNNNINNDYNNNNNNSGWVLFAKMICTYSNNAFKIFNVQKFLLSGSSLAMVVVQILLEIFRSYMPK